MPAEFDRCVKAGGRVRTVSGPNTRLGLKKGEYVKFCFLKGKSFRGHVHKRSPLEKVARERDGA